MQIRGAHRSVTAMWQTRQVGAGRLSPAGSPRSTLFGRVVMLWGALALGGVGQAGLSAATPKQDGASEAAKPVEAVEEPTEPTLAPVRPGAGELNMKPIWDGRPPQTMDELRAFESHVRQLTESLKKYVVGVTVGSAQGSGVVVSEDGLVLTAAHVNGDKDRTVVFHFPDGSTKRGKTLGLNDGIDSGMMKIDLKKGEKLPFVELGNSNDLNLGQWCVALGHPGGYQEGRQPVLRIGRVISMTGSFVRTDCTLVGGDSGGPLFDMDGKLIGIHSRIGMKLSANMHVPITTYVDTWERLEKGERWKEAGGRSASQDRPFIGFSGKLSDDEPKVFLIDEVTSSSPAAKAGLKVGDIIVNFDGQSLDSIDALRKSVGATKPGDKINLEVRRGEETLTLKVVVGSR